MLPSVKFTEDKVLVFIIPPRKCEDIVTGTRCCCVDENCRYL